MNNGFFYPKKGDFPRLIYSRTDPKQDTPNLSLSRYPTLSFPPRPINLHQVLNPKDLNLNLNKYRKKTEVITEETMQHLEICSDVIMEVKGMVHYGAGNQLFSMLDTGGESTIRKKMSRESIKEAAQESSADKSSSGKTARKIKYAMHYQAGNCDEMNAIAFGILKTKGLKAPIFSMADLQQDHAYTLIGDPRAPEWGETNTVVVDAWPVYRTAYTLKQSRYTLKTNPQVTQAHPASTPIPESIKVYETVDTHCVNQYLDRIFLPNVGHELIEFLYENIPNPKLCRDERVGTKDPSTRYQIKGEAPRTFDEISMQELKKYRAVQAKTEQFLSTHPNWDIQQTSKSNFFSYLKSALSSKSSNKDD